MSRTCHDPRLAALELAVESTDRLIETSHVVERAEAFLAFLTKEPSVSKPDAHTALLGGLRAAKGSAADFVVTTYGGQVYEIWADGRVAGFGGCIVTNRLTPLINAKIAEALNAKATS